MQKAHGDAEGDTIAVAVSRLGSDVIPVTLSKDATVRDALAKAGVSTSGNVQYFVQGVRADMDDVLEDGDVLALVTPKQAGSK